jgi:ABC-2 family transporter protein
MTTATTTAGTPAGAARRPVRWTSLGWVTLRQRRGAMIGVASLLGLLAVYLVVMAIIENNAYAAVTACHPAAAVKCQRLAQAFSATYWGGDSSAVSSGGAQTVSSLMFAVPALLGAFVGAPLVSRELETGTFRFAWTQGAGRTRWAISTLVLPAVLLTAVTGAFTALFWWYFRPFLADGQVSEFLPLAFGLLGVAFAAWTLFAFALAAFTGTWFRRTVPAMAVTLVVYIVIAIATATSVRPHYAAPAVVSGWNHGGAGGWVISSWVRSPSGQRLSPAALDTLPLPASVQNSQRPDAFTNWLTSHGYTLWQSVQPNSRFWQFQLTEGGWLLAVSALLIGAAVALIRRRGA